MEKLKSLVAQVANAIERSHMQIMFAESCTGGLVAASLAQIPGISRFLTGSMVVYQEATKSTWLGIDEDLLRQKGSVHEDVAAEMAAKGIEKTPHAELAVSITGHLGPNAPDSLDGVIYVGWQRRGRATKGVAPVVSRMQLRRRTRRGRQGEAAVHVLYTVLAALEIPD
jgi:nicotinamide-nucleotide amidase